MLIVCYMYDENVGLYAKPKTGEKQKKQLYAKPVGNFIFVC